MHLIPLNINLLLQNMIWTIYPIGTNLHFLQHKIKNNMSNAFNDMENLKEAYNLDKLMIHRRTR